MEQNKKEKQLQKELVKQIKGILPKGYKVYSGAKLFYELSINNKLELQQEPKIPKRGKSAFETDILITRVQGEIEIPRVVIELKRTLTTHDIIVYSGKAIRHKRVYPYLRYGLLIFNEDKIPQRFFTHNEGIDFAIGYKGLKDTKLLLKLIMDQIFHSEKLEQNMFTNVKYSFFSMEPKLENLVKK